MLVDVDDLRSLGTPARTRRAVDVGHHPGRRFARMGTPHAAGVVGQDHHPADHLARPRALDELDGHLAASDDALRTLGAGAVLGQIELLEFLGHGAPVAAESESVHHRTVGDRVDPDRLAGWLVVQRTGRRLESTDVVLEGHGFDPRERHGVAPVGGDTAEGDLGAAHVVVTVDRAEGVTLLRRDVGADHREDGHREDGPEVGEERAHG